MQANSPGGGSNEARGSGGAGASDGWAIGRPVHQAPAPAPPTAAPAPAIPAALPVPAAPGAPAVLTPEGVGARGTPARVVPAGGGPMTTAVGDRLLTEGVSITPKKYNRQCPLKDKDKSAALICSAEKYVTALHLSGSPMLGLKVPSTERTTTML